MLETISCIDNDDDKTKEFSYSTGLLVVMLFIDRIGRIKTLVIGFGATSLLFGLLTLCNGE